MSAETWEWDDVPPTRQDGHLALVAELKARPGQWVRLPASESRQCARQQAYRIRRGVVKSLVGCEATARQDHVYVRWPE